MLGSYAIPGLRGSKAPPRKAKPSRSKSVSKSPPSVKATPVTDPPVSTGSSSSSSAALSHESRLLAPTLSSKKKKTKKGVSSQGWDSVGIPGLRRATPGHFRSKSRPGRPKSARPAQSQLARESSYKKRQAHLVARARRRQNRPPPLMQYLHSSASMPNTPLLEAGTESDAAASSDRVESDAASAPEKPASTGGAKQGSSSASGKRRLRRKGHRSATLPEDFTKESFSRSMKGSGMVLAKAKHAFYAVPGMTSPSPVSPPVRPMTPDPDSGMHYAMSPIQRRLAKLRASAGSSPDQSPRRLGSDVNELLRREKKLTAVAKEVDEITKMLEAARSKQQHNKTPQSPPQSSTSPQTPAPMYGDLSYDGGDLKHSTAGIEEVKQKYKQMKANNTHLALKSRIASLMKKSSSSGSNLTADQARKLLMKRRGARGTEDSPGSPYLTSPDSPGASVESFSPRRRSRSPGSPADDDSSASGSQVKAPTSSSGKSKKMLREESLNRLLRPTKSSARKVSAKRNSVSSNGSRKQPSKSRSGAQKGKQ